MSPGLCDAYLDVATAKADLSKSGLLINTMISLSVNLISPVTALYCSFRRVQIEMAGSDGR